MCQREQEALPCLSHGEREPGHWYCNLFLVSHCCSWSETDLIQIRKVKVHYEHPGHEKPKLILAIAAKGRSL